MFRSYASGSSGNLYEADDGQTRILIECGLPIKHMLKLLPEGLSPYAACLITHEHQDHAKSAHELIRRGMPVYATNGTLGALQIEGPGAAAIQPLQEFSIGTLSILPFDVRHDAQKPVGYLIYSMATGDKLLFVTDTYKVGYTFSGLTEIAIECNFCDDMLSSNLPDSLIQRIKRNHMSLASCENFLSLCQLTHVKSVHLLHLSDGNSNINKMYLEIKALTGKEVYIA